MNFIYSVPYNVINVLFQKLTSPLCNHVSEKEEPKSKIQTVNNGFKNDSLHHNKKMELSEVKHYQTSNNSPISNQFEQLSLSNNDHECGENMANEIQGRPCESEEIPDYKFLVSDFNLLRVQREEFSDSESLASNDTTDTLDDNQIECLLLEKVMPLDGQEIETENSIDDYTSKDNNHL